MRADFRRRLAALEGKKVVASCTWFVFGISAEHEDTDVIGYDHGQGVVMRGPNESLESLKERTKQASAGPTVVMIQPLMASKAAIQP